MTILRHRPTRRFVALLVRCRCGRKFLHRLDRPRVACLRCGRTAELRPMVERLHAAAAASGVRVPRAARRTGPRHAA
ncbi:MAG TPA: hypothetical protein VEQ10_17115 [Vicinamibacteria bacterium]|nr:hypothetical protein [Vicinamibacteria bacterium]